MRKTLWSCSPEASRRRCRPARAAAAPPPRPAGRAAADDLQGRGQLRRDRRHRHRPAGQLRPQPDEGRLPGPRAGQAADGRRSLSLVDIPVEKFDPPLFKTTPIEPDVRSNRKDFNGRVFVIVLDDLNTDVLAQRARQDRRSRSSSSATSAPTTSPRSCRPAARKRRRQEFTSSRERLLRAVDQFMGQKERSATLERDRRVHTAREAWASAGGRVIRRKRSASTRRATPSRC